MLKVLVVDDSAVFRTLLGRIINGNSDLRVQGYATSGEEAVEMAARLQPDVITMDVHMPGIDGLETTSRIMESSPCPIVIVTGHGNPDELAASFRIFEAGAVAMLRKPGSPSEPGFARRAEEIVRTLRVMAQVKVVKRRARKPPETPSTLPHLRATSKVVAIAASTGGPAALAEVLRSLPSDLSVPVVIVQHIAEGFDAGLVKWLDSVSPMPVELATSGRRMIAGRVLVAPQGRHLLVSGDTIRFQASSAADRHSPSADRLFSSIAKTFGAASLGVILTGMGSDGAHGSLDISRMGGIVIAQDEATSVVYGMARAASLVGAVNVELPLTQIPHAIIKLCAPDKKMSPSVDRL